MNCDDPQNVNLLVHLQNFNFFKSKMERLYFFEKADQRMQN